MTLTPDNLVRRDVLACASILVATLAKGVTAPESHNAEGTAVADICEQAFYLAAPVDDWEEAAIQAGWTIDGNEFVHPDDPTIRFDDPQRAGEHYGFDPYQWEVYEHWIVSEWLADKLEAEGERIDRDFAGLCIWGRTTTGQAINMDSVIRRICAAANT